MAPHSSTLAWKIPWTEEPGRLQSMGSLRVGHDWAFHFNALEKEMATHSSVRAWRISGTVEPGELPSVGLHRVGRWSDLAAAATATVLTHLKRPWCWERLKAEGEGSDRGWGDWMASLTQWTWVWVNSGSWQGTGRPGMLQPMGSQRVRHNWTELNSTIEVSLGG